VNIYAIPRRLLASFLPVKLDVPYDEMRDQQVITTFGLQRSGQHLVIDWICHGLLDVIHLNHCRFYPECWNVALSPMTGRRVVYRNGMRDDSGIQGRENYEESLPADPPSALLYSVEDERLTWSPYRRLLAEYDPQTVLIIRDPANWLASSLKHDRHSKRELRKHAGILKEYIAHALQASESDAGPVDIAINYSRFIQDRAYRATVAERLGLKDFDKAETALVHTPSFGGGSSFEPDEDASPEEASASEEGSGETPSTLSRWVRYKNDSFFRSVLQDDELLELSYRFFDDLPGLPEIA